MHNLDPDHGPEAALLGAAEIRTLADRLGLRPTKQLGQNFVIDPNTIRRIVTVAAVEAGEHVVEIGPGLGSLTLGLLETGASVTAVEIDERLAAELPETITAHQPGAAGRLTVVDDDAMRITELPGRPDVLVANLPYNVAVPVLLHLLATFEHLKRALVMVQSEVADRLAAAPGSRTYGVPSIKAAWFAEVKRAGTVGRNVFWPAPNVGSGLVELIMRRPGRTADRAEVFAAVDAAFAQRRKTLRSALAGWAGGAPEAGQALEKAGIDPVRRGETLTVDDFIRLAAARDPR